MAGEQQKRKHPGNSASSTLSKPFKSPLRTREVSSLLPTPTPDVAGAPKDKPTTATSATPAENADRFVSPQSNSHSLATAKAPKAALERRALLADPELVNRQKQQRSLESRLATLRTELDNAKQALRIETSNKDAELEALVIKWRRISQEAADEVFAGAQERVTMMGGMAAWRDRSNQDAARWALEDEDPVPDEEDGDELLQTGLRDSIRSKQEDDSKQEVDAQDEVEFI